MAFSIGSLRRASFNGIPFWVLHGDIEAGHRVSTTHIPAGRHINESFGPAARKFEIDAYVSGDGLFAADALLIAAESAHVGALILPDQFGAVVRITKAKRRFDRDKLGFITVTIEAVAEPSIFGGLAGALSIFGLAQQIFAATSAAVALVGGIASALAPPRSVRLSSPALPAAVGAADLSSSQAATMAAGSGVIADLSALATLCRLSAEAQARFDQALAPALAALPALNLAPQTFGEAVSAAALSLGDEAHPPRLQEALILLGAPSPAPAPASTTATDQIIAAIDAAAPRFISVLRALAVAQSQARAEWVDRPSALRSRAVAAAVFDDALSRLDRDSLSVHRALSELRALVTERATQSAASLSPLVTVSANLRRPSLVWAWRLYANPNRAAELVARSGAAHPAFLPERFEALAR